MGIRCSISNPDSIPKLKLYNNPLSKRHTKVDFMKGRKVARLHKATHSRYKGSSVFPTTSLRHQSSSHWQSSRVKSPLDHPPSGHSLKPISTPNKVGDSRRWYWCLVSSPAVCPEITCQGSKGPSNRILNQFHQQTEGIGGKGFANA